ncbi:hypothetical protein [Lacticaseibacillus jixiensis]|uniref:hypothetical protein n=1 Tax=Lacticaseibacillus jixiensis TaxID=3231926 RepID=UPI0036F26492
MTVNFFGVPIDMVMHLQAVPYPVWAAQLVISVFFIAGFMTQYQSVYRYTFETPEAKHRLTGRISLMILSVGVAVIVHLMGYIVGSNGVMFHNIGLFLLLFALMDEEIGLWEFGVRTAALVSVWCMHHNMHFDRPQFWISLFLLGIVIIVTRRYRHSIRQHLWFSFGVFTLNYS